MIRSSRTLPRIPPPPRTRASRFAARFAGPGSSTREPAKRSSPSTRSRSRRSRTASWRFGSRGDFLRRRATPRSVRTHPRGTSPFASAPAGGSRRRARSPCSTATGSRSPAACCARRPRRSGARVVSRPGQPTTRTRRERPVENDAKTPIRDALPHAAVQVRFFFVMAFSF